MEEKKESTASVKEMFGGKPLLSFEVFPPRTERGMTRLCGPGGVLDQLYALNPALPGSERGSFHPLGRLSTSLRQKSISRSVYCGKAMLSMFCWSTFSST